MPSSPRSRDAQGGTVVAQGSQLQMQGAITVTGEPLKMQGQGDTPESEVQQISVSGPASGSFQLVFTNSTRRLFRLPFHSLRRQRAKWCKTP